MSAASVRSPRSIAAVAAVALVSTLGACGGGSSSTSRGSDPQQAMLAFARCMRQHGVNVPDPKGGQSGVTLQFNQTSKTTVDAANRACQRLLKGSIKPPSAADRRRALDGALRYARCMRSHGVNVPDPTPDNSGAIKLMGGGVAPDDPGFQRADATCRSQLPQPKGGFGMQLRH